MDNSILKLKQSTDLKALISKYTQLTQRGQRWVGLCPLHHDSKPSLIVSNTRWVCYVCNLSGDCLDFVMAVEKCDFKEALEMLGGKRELGPEKGRWVPEMPVEDDTESRLEMCRALLPLPALLRALAVDNVPARLLDVARLDVTPLGTKHEDAGELKLIRYVMALDPGVRGDARALAYYEELAQNYAFLTQK